MSSSLKVIHGTQSLTDSQWTLLDITWRCCGQILHGKFDDRQREDMTRLIEMGYVVHRREADELWATEEGERALIHDPMR